VPLIYQVIEIRYEIVQRAPNAVAKWYSAIHTASRLLNNLLRRQRQVKLIEIVNALLDRPMPDFLTLIF
jgi:hypothetical protein